MTSTPRKGKSCMILLLKAGAALLLAIAAALAVWMIVNRPPSTEPVRRDHLTEREIAIVREVLRLRRFVGEDIWPGFGARPIPLQLFNDQYGFAVGVQSAPEGWEEVPGGRVDGMPYFRTARPEKQAFAVRVGPQWAGSLSVKDVLDAQAPRALREHLPFVGRLIPYRLFIISTDQYVAAILHEQFHAFQAMTNPARFQRALDSYRAQDAYPWARDGFRSAWLEEVRLLQAALAAPLTVDKARLAGQFIAKRKARRQAFLSEPAAISFEREVEWLEGLGKYAEVRAYQLAAALPYQPLPEMAGDPQFARYGKFGRWWKQELRNMTVRMNLRGDLPFYYSGVMQAMLLDELRPGWKTDFLAGEASFEESLAAAAR